MLVRAVFEGRGRLQTRTSAVETADDTAGAGGDGAADGSPGDTAGGIVMLGAADAGGDVAADGSTDDTAGISVTLDPAGAGTDGAADGRLLLHVIVAA